MLLDITYFNKIMASVHKKNIYLSNFTVILLLGIIPVCIWFVLCTSVCVCVCVCVSPDRCVLNIIVILQFAPVYFCYSVSYRLNKCIDLLEQFLLLHVEDLLWNQCQLTKQDPLRQLWPDIIIFLVTIPDRVIAKQRDEAR